MTSDSKISNQIVESGALSQNANQQLTVSICIPTHNRATILRRTLESLRKCVKSTSAAAEIVIVANACTDETVSVSKTFAADSPVPVLCVEDPFPNLNHARNRCVQESCGKIIALLDDDVLVHVNWLRELLNAYEQTNADIIGGPIELCWDGLKRPAWFDKSFDTFLTVKDHGSQIKQLDSMYSVAGANFSFRRNVFSEIGPFVVGLDRTSDKLLSGGENEFIGRALSRGKTLFYAPGASLQHIVTPNRLTLQYIGGVSAGNAESRIYLKHNFGTIAKMRSFFGHVYLTLIHGVFEILTRKNTFKHAHHHVLRRAGVGGLRGIWNRLRARTPLS